MDYHLEHNRDHGNHEASNKVYGQSSRQASQSTKLGDRFKLDQLEPSYADFHPEVVRNVDHGLQKSTGFHQKRQAQRKVDELVRYMSNLPSYLEKGEKRQDKALNVGVLDWRHLEKWQNNQRQFPNQSCRSSPSSSNTSAFSSTEGTASYSSRGHSCSPINKRVQRTPLESNLHASPNKVCSEGFKSSEKDSFRPHDGVAIPSNYLKVQQNILKTHQSFNKYTENKVQECKNKQSDLQSISNRKSGESENQGVASCSKGKLKVQDCDYFEEKEKLQGPDCDHSSKYCMDGKQTMVLLLPKNGQEINPAASSDQSDSTGKYDRGPVIASQQSFSDESDSEANEPSCKITHSFPLSCTADCIRHPHIEQASSTATTIIGSSFEVSQLSAHSTSISVSPVRGKKLEGKRSNRTHHNSAEGPKLKMDTEGDSKVRNPSPIRRISFSMGTMGRSSGSKDISSIPQRNYRTGKFGSGEAEISVSSVDSSCSKSIANGKARSSPLRRLLDPLFKPKAGNSDYSPYSSQGASVPLHMASKKSNGRGEASALHSVKMKLDLGSCKATDIDHPHDLVKGKPTMAQALLQVAVKNQLPLFTFAVENSSDILAATMRKQNTGRKDGNSWIYTFFTVHEMKKKNGNWLNHGSKDRSHGFMPNIVGQMKVSDVPTTELSRQNSGDQCSIWEFILFAMNVRQADQQTSELQANNELAAIVVKQPKMTSRNSNEAGQKNCDSQKLSMVDSKAQSQEVCSCSDWRDVEESASSAGRLNHFGVTVILPGADHGLPMKGKPSPLIERWRLGGSCDCGGWDLGCRLGVLTGQTQFNRKSMSHKAQSTPRKFQLYSQEPVLDRKPGFSLSFFKDGIYSVEFDSSLKLLQAFSISIAVLNGLKPAEFSELSNFLGRKSSEDTTLETDGAMVSNRDQKETPSYISFPPSSPVERV